jgi:carnitine O-acetyltransferase
MSLRRSLSVESALFVEAFDDSKKPLAEKLSLFQAAAKTHHKTLVEGSSGRGIDRHLMGLYLCLQKDEMHEIFTDPSYSRSKTYRLSTSSLGLGKNLEATGFGAATTDGYGINYISSDHFFRFGIETKKECPETSTEKFYATLQRTMRDLRTAFQVSNDQSKL